MDPSAPVTIKQWFVYMVRCSDGTFYTGYTCDLEKRIAKHNTGRGAKYTRCRLPVVLIFSKEFPSKSEAMSGEYNLKQLNRKEKELLINERSRIKIPVGWKNLDL
jgi:putative endonuclease